MERICIRNKFKSIDFSLSELKSFSNHLEAVNSFLFFFLGYIALARRLSFEADAEKLLVFIASTDFNGFKGKIMIFQRQICNLR